MMTGTPLQIGALRHIYLIIMVRYILVIPITIVYILIFVSGVVGNVAVCAVIIRNPSMHTATNCYLFSLAVSDLTVLLFGM